MKIFDKMDDAILVDLLFDSNCTLQEIADDLSVPLDQVKKRIKELGLTWVRSNKGYASRGQAALTALFKKLLPGEIIVSEHHIGERLRLDVYCPRLKLAAEYHGRQHFEYVDFFHKSYDKFDEHYQRDLRKVELCKEHGIALVVFRYNDILNEDVVFDRIMTAIRNTAPVVNSEKKPAAGSNAYYEAAKRRRREYQRELYRKMKKKHQSHL